MVRRVSEPPVAAVHDTEVARLSGHDPNRQASIHRLAVRSRFRRPPQISAWLQSWCRRKLVTTSSKISVAPCLSAIRRQLGLRLLRRQIRAPAQDGLDQDRCDVFACPLQDVQSLQGAIVDHDYVLDHVRWNAGASGTEAVPGS
jgi:hypothetical protein